MHVDVAEGAVLAVDQADVVEKDANTLDPWNRVVLARLIQQPSAVHAPDARIVDIPVIRRREACHASSKCAGSRR